MGSERQPLARSFLGAPAPGRFYYGASVPHYRSLPAFEADLGAALALNRSYFNADETRELVLQARVDLSKRRLPHVSIKPVGTWADVAAGRRDAWLVEMMSGLAHQDRPVFLSIHHEPENDAGPPGMASGDFVAMQRRAISLARDLAPNVTVVPVLAHWTFDPVRRDSAPARWVVDEARVFGIDVFNPWSPSNGKTWRSLGSRLDEVAPWIGDKPIAIGEYGCRFDPVQPGRTAQWLDDAVTYARTHNVVSMSYYNSRLNAPEGSWELAGEAERRFARLLQQPWVARPA